jgi:hypothetical protein
MDVPRSLGDRYATEVLANYAALQANPSIFEGDREKLTRDMILFSLIVYLETRQHDWKMEERHYATSTSTITRMQDKSNPCTKISYDYILRMLITANNEFALTRPITPFSYMCLPPQSSVRLDQSSITLRNPFCTILFFHGAGVFRVTYDAAGLAHGRCSCSSRWKAALRDASDRAPSNTQNVMDNGTASGLR